MKVSHSPHRKESEGAVAPVGWCRAPQPALLALLAGLGLFLLAGVVRISAGGPATAPKRVPAFKYSYRVLEVYLNGEFVTTINDEGLTFSGKEEIRVWGVLKGEKTPSRLFNDVPGDGSLSGDGDLLSPLAPMLKGTLTLQNPSSDIGVNGVLQASDCGRYFYTQGAGVEMRNGDVKNFSCGRTPLHDVGSFMGAMRLSGSEKVKVHWVLPGVSYKCGPVTIDYNDQHRLKRIEGDPALSTADDPNQEAQTYPLSVFRQKRFKLDIDIAHSWEPDYATKANVVWKGEVWLERIESGKVKK
jgi:hypothetical protein